MEYTFKLYNEESYVVADKTELCFDDKDAVSVGQSWMKSFNRSDLTLSISRMQEIHHEHV